jgi:hypothetical protein
LRNSRKAQLATRRAREPTQSSSKRSRLLWRRCETTLFGCWRGRVLLVEAARTYPTFGFAAVARGLSASMGARVAFVKRATAAYMLNVKMSSVACCRPSVA